MELLEYLIDGIREDCNEIKGQKPYIPNEEAEGYNEEELENQAFANYKKRNNSFVDEQFLGFFLSIFTCPEDETQCGRISSTMDPYTSVKLELPSIWNKSTDQKLVELEHLLEQFVKKQILQEENKWFCDRCKTHKEASKKLEFRTVPPVLVLQLKRFEYNQLSRQRINTQIIFPLEGLDMEPFCTESAQQQLMQEFSYDLAGICEHFGTG